MKSAHAVRIYLYILLFYNPPAEVAKKSVRYVATRIAAPIRKMVNPIERTPFTISSSSAIPLIMCTEKRMNTAKGAPARIQPINLRRTESCNDIRLK